jgi:hypothetical protein
MGLWPWANLQGGGPDSILVKMLFLLTFLAINAFAQPAQTFEFTYGENGVWLTDTIALDSQGWPELLNQKTHQSKPALKRAPEVPGASTELRGLQTQELWTVTQEWNWEWEIRFGEWVKTELDRTWWRRHGIATDCADVILSARWIFARMHGLPAANRLITGHWFTHRSVKPAWENLPTAPEWFNDQKFLAALDYLLSQAFTHSLLQDSYPTAINSLALIPGGYHIKIFDDTGHAQLIHSIGTQADQVPVLTLNSTAPRALRDLAEYVFMDNEARNPDWGFMRMRWPQWIDGNVTLVEPAQMPHYTLEQFARGFVTYPRNYFWEEVYHRLNPQADLGLLTERTLIQVRDLLLARVPVVEEGWAVCSATPCKQGTLEWEAWSTPSRDKRILSSVDTFAALYARTGSTDKLRRLFREKILTFERDRYTLFQLIQIWQRGAYSSDPNQPIRVRWGI